MLAICAAGACGSSADESTSGSSTSTSSCPWYSDCVDRQSQCGGDADPDVQCTEACDQKKNFADPACFDAVYGQYIDCLNQGGTCDGATVGPCSEQLNAHTGDCN